MNLVFNLFITVFIVGIIVYLKTKPKVKSIYPDIISSDKYKVKGRYE